LAAASIVVVTRRQRRLVLAVVVFITIIIIINNIIAIVLALRLDPMGSRQAEPIGRRLGTRRLDPYVFASMRRQGVVVTRHLHRLLFLLLFRPLVALKHILLLRLHRHVRRIRSLAFRVLLARAVGAGAVLPT
jgi:hypothetical protein